MESKSVNTNTWIVFFISFIVFLATAFLCANFKEYQNLIFATLTIPSVILLGLSTMSLVAHKINKDKHDRRKSN